MSQLRNHPHIVKCNNSAIHRLLQLILARTVPCSRLKVGISAGLTLLVFPTIIIVARPKPGLAVADTNCRAQKARFRPGHDLVSDLLQAPFGPLAVHGTSIQGVDYIVPRLIGRCKGKIKNNSCHKLPF